MKNSIEKLTVDFHINAKKDGKIYEKNLSTKEKTKK